MNTSPFNITNNLYVPVSRNMDNYFEQRYVLLRLKEQRIYTDEELYFLPNISAEHPHFREWLIRKQSCNQLIAKLEKKKDILNILEVGCGNGWMSHQLSRIPGSRVIGIDINMVELQQAARVFNTNSKLKFIYGDIRSGLINDLKFDVIIFAASIQYFPCLQEILDVSLSQLYSGGEIHIIDSHFYKPEEQDAASVRTKSYFGSMGFPEMSAYYYHHCITELDAYPYKVLRNPTSIKNKFFGRNPFYWISFEKK
ncbi:MAG: class I SAM-dependent methyltransferase [Bacteroidetes bacterium]|nr:class I SAM-dependent methyltransferase [Bacteroidota bacterium]